MKARIAKEKELVLLYRLDAAQENGRKVRETAEKLGIEVRDVTRQMLSLPLGGCAGLHGFPVELEAEVAPMADVPEYEALVMIGLTDGRMDQFLSGLREAGAKVRLKATLTPHNRSWPFGKLLQELYREDSVMGALTMLQKRLVSAKQISADGFSEEKRRELDEAIQRAQILVEGSQELTAEKLERAHRALAAAMGE